MPRTSSRQHRSARRWAVPVSITAAVALAVALVVAAATDPNDARAHRDDPTVSVRAAAPTGPVAPGSTVPDVTTTAATTTTTLPLSQPSDPPEDPHAKVPVVRLGEIDIPKIGLVHPVYEGIWLTVIDQGPGHWPGTPLPGGWGNVVFAGHRVTHSHPFRRLDELAPGDLVTFRMDRAGAYTYRVTGSEIVAPAETRIVDQRPGRTLTLFACHPPGSASRRYVVHAELVSPPAPGR
ncbi:MAG: class E sortase [Acidimicrobiia bacterium]